MASIWLTDWGIPSSMPMVSTCSMPSVLAKTRSKSGGAATRAGPPSLVRDVDAGRSQGNLDQRGQPGQGGQLVFPVVVDQSVPGGGIGPSLKPGRHRQKRAVGQQIVGQRGRQLVDPRVVRIPGQRVPAALRQIDEVGVVEPVFEPGQELVE